MSKEVLRTELDWIKDETIKKFTEFCLDNAPPYFWVNPASSTGKYHSKDAAGSGGLARHTRATAYATKELARSYQLTPLETDAAIAAAILHDIQKYGAGLPHTTKTHDYDGALFIHRLAARFSAETEVPMLKEICGGIAWHMGPWSIRKEGIPLKKFPEEYSRIEQLVHIADMVASRKDIKFTFLEPNSLVG